MKILCEFTAYYPSNEGVEGGYLDALGNLLNPDELTCAAPSCIPFYTKLRIMKAKKQWLKKYQYYLLMIN